MRRRCTHRVRSVLRVESTPGAGPQGPVFDVERTHTAYTQVKRCLEGAQLVSAKKQIDFVRKEGGSIFEEPVVRLANLLKITDNSHDQNGNGSFSYHPFVGPEASIFEDQVDSIGNVYQVVETRDLSMHAVESSNLTRQGMFSQALSKSPIELFVRMSPCDEGRSKVLTSHFDSCIPLVYRLTTKIPSLASFRRASFSFRAPSICRLAVVRRFKWIERSTWTSWR